MKSEEKTNKIYNTVECQISDFNKKYDDTEQFNI